MPVRSPAFVLLRCFCNRQGELFWRLQLLTSMNIYILINSINLSCFIKKTLKISSKCLFKVLGSPFGFTTSKKWFVYKTNHFYFILCNPIYISNYFSINFDATSVSSNFKCFLLLYFIYCRFFIIQALQTCHLFLFCKNLFTAHIIIAITCYHIKMFSQPFFFNRSQAHKLNVAFCLPIQ